MVVVVTVYNNLYIFCRAQCRKLKSCELSIWQYLPFSAVYLRRSSRRPFNTIRSIIKLNIDISCVVPQAQICVCLKCDLCSWKPLHFSHPLRTFNQSVPSLPSCSETGGGHGRSVMNFSLRLNFFNGPNISP